MSPFGIHRMCRTGVSDPEDGINLGEALRCAPRERTQDAATPRLPALLAQA